MAKKGISQKMSAPEKNSLSDVALKGANGYLSIPTHTGMLKYTIRHVQQIRKYIFFTQNGQNVNKSENVHS